MHRAILLFLFVLPLFLSACNKSSDDNNTLPGNDKQLISISGVRDVRFDVDGNAGLQLSVQLLAPKQEQVTLSITGLPAGLTAVIQPASGMPPFTSAVAFSKASSLLPGTYPIRLIATSATYSSTYELSVIVPGYEFNVNGIRNISLFHATLKDTLQLQVSYVSGIKEPVALTVTGLPAGVTANLSPNTGTPDFSSSIYFSATNSVPPGTYPVKIIGSASHTTKTYDVNLTVPAFNGYKFNALDFHTQSMSVSAVGGNGRFEIIPIEQPGGGGDAVEGIISGPWPTADGTYTYQTSTGLPTAGNIRLRCTYTSVYTCIAGRTVTVKIAGGKMSVNTNPIPATSASVTLLLQVDAHQP